MTKQEMIRGAIKTYIFMEGSIGDIEGNKLTDDILSYLHSKGVVIKVARELPKIPINKALLEEIGVFFEEAGFVAVDSLVEE